MTEMFPAEIWDSPEAFKFAGIRGYDPMTAKELETEEVQNAKFLDSENFIEEKFDGTRALVYFLSAKNINGGEDGYCRVFSRRVSKKTGFYAENTDRVPHIRDIDKPEMAGTILDGEMFINGLPFKAVASVLNCLPEEADERQIRDGNITFHAFDILFFDGVDVRNVPLFKRKEYLHLAVEEADSEWIEEVKYFRCGDHINASLQEIAGDSFNKLLENRDALTPFPELLDATYKAEINPDSKISPRAYYEYIVASGGEGVIVKNSAGKYHHKRGWEYSKVKKFLTRDLIVTGFSDPTKEYSGKEIHKWNYWVRKKDGAKILGNFYGNDDYFPVTRHYFYDQVGNLLLGVLISPEELEKIPEKKKGFLSFPEELNVEAPEGYQIMEVCECAGFDDEMRKHFSENKDDMYGSVIEVKANELFKDTGKMRHPRVLRIRYDKEAERCTGKDHVGEESVI